MQIPYITFDHVSFSFPGSDQPLIKQLNLSLQQQRIGLVGNNGCGKSTLLALLRGEQTPDQGCITVVGKLAYVPQNSSALSKQSVAQVLQVADTLAALARIEAGSIAESDYQCVGEQWLLRETLQSKLTDIGLPHLSLTTPFAQLSGGEQTRVLLLRCLLSDADFLLLDEPSNNLDYASRQALYQMLDNWQKGVIVASHDRELLRHMQHIIELTSVGVNQYGGNYDDYCEQKSRAEAAREQQLQTGLQRLKVTKQQVQKRVIQHQKGEQKGRNLRKCDSQPKIVLNAMRENSEKTKSRITKQSARKLDAVENDIQQAKAQLASDKQLNFSLPATQVPSNKQVITVQDLSFAYSTTRSLLNNINFSLIGSERLAIAGDNGSGKSTLVKLLLGQLTPTAGEINVGVKRLAYLDQFCSQLDDESSVLENFQRLNPEQSITQCHQHLAQFKFRNRQALVKVKKLSGGERLRALLACVLMASEPPQLLILDEPTNHLDLQSLDYLQQVLRCYQGAMLVISHDNDFLTAIDVQRSITIKT